MGLSSSQARLLTLTSRQHAIEYKAQKLEAEKLQLANDSDQVYNTYLSKLDAKKLQYKHVENDGSINFLDANFAALKEEKMLFKVGDYICVDYNQVKNAMMQAYGIQITAPDSYTVLTSLISEGYVVMMQENDNLPDGLSYTKQGGQWKFDITYQYTDGSGTLQTVTEPIVMDSSNASFANGLQVGSSADLLSHGNERISDYLNDYFKDTSISTSTKVQEVSDELDLKKAEAEYESDMSKINRKDTQYDTQLSQLETERKAIKEEIESLKNVAKDNVERTFKLFT